MMNPETVDKLRELLGDAADKLQPLGEELVRQVQARALFMGIVDSVLAGVALLIALLMAGLIYRHREAIFSDDGNGPPAIMGGIICLILMVAGIVALDAALGQFCVYFAPLVHLIGK